MTTQTKKVLANNALIAAKASVIGSILIAIMGDNLGFWTV